MLLYIVRRLLMVIPLIIGVGTLTFILAHLSPGGPGALFYSPMNRESLASINHRLGLDAPIWVQYLRWLRLLLHADLGNSLINGGPVTSIILSRLPLTAELMGGAIGLSLIIGVPLGILAAIYHNRTFDRVASIGALLGLALPQFWAALVAIVVFSVNLHWFPSGGNQSLDTSSDLLDKLDHLILPAGVLSLVYTGRWALFLRSGMLDVIRQDYIRTARAKGVPRWKVVLRHSVRNALIPLVTVIGLTLPDLLGGAVVIESIFGWPGMGLMLITAGFQRDYPVILGATILAGLLVIAGNLLADIAYSVLDPRIRLQ